MKIFLMSSFILFSLSLHADPNHSKNFTQVLTVGHHDVQKFELKKEYKNKAYQWTLRENRNGLLLGGRAITGATYSKIQKDWNRLFVDRKSDSASQCGDAILIELSHGNDVKRQIYCRDNLTRSKDKEISLFTFKLSALAQGKILFYE